MFGNFITWVLIPLVLTTTAALSEDDNDFLRNYLDTVNKDLADIYNDDKSASFDFEIHGRSEDITKANEAKTKFMEYVRRINNDIGPLSDIRSDDNDLARQLKKLPKLGYNVLNEEEMKEIEEASSNMSMIYQTVKLCSYKDPTNCNITLIPGIQDTLHSSNDLTEVEYYWLEWKNRTGAGLKDSFQKFVDLYKKTAQLNGFSKPSEMWFKNFEEDNVLDQLEKIMSEIHPMYEQFHAYVRFLLRQKYGEHLVAPYSPYPQHISEIFLGSAYLYDDTGRFMFPYPEAGLPNITEKLIDQGYTVEKLFEISTDFLASVGMPRIPDSFLETNGMKVSEPEKKVLGCWNKAWNFHGQKMTKISYCPEVNFQKYLDMHELVSNIYYYDSWKNLPTVYQSEPLPNFSDAIAKTFSLSASTPKHLEKIGLIPEGTFTEEMRINRIYLEGMQQFFLLPVLFILDKYRVDILDGVIPSWDNCAYWELNEKYLGSMPPVERHPGDFDAPSKLLVGVDDEYSSVIVSIIAQYQIYRHFCEITGEYIRGDPDHPLDNCDLSDYTELGSIVQQAMSLGSSRPWKDVLEVLTGSKGLDVSGLLEYFEPLLKWLQQQNQENGVEVGWIDSKRCH